MTRGFKSLLVASKEIIDGGSKEIGGHHVGHVIDALVKSGLTSTQARETVATMVRHDYLTYFEENNTGHIVQLTKRACDEIRKYNALKECV